MGDSRSFRLAWFTKPSADDAVLRIVDGHGSHKELDFVDEGSGASPSNIITPSLSVPTSTVTKALPSTSTLSEFASILKQVSCLPSCGEKSAVQEKHTAKKIKRKIPFGQVDSSAKTKNKVDKTKRKYQSNANVLPSTSKDSDATCKTKRKYQSNANVPPSTSKDSDATCIVFGESFDENWIQCRICRDSSHEVCAGIDDSLYYYWDVYKLNKTTTGLPFGPGVGV
ncbi:hypothetical protein QE152_g40481 [Popillia japonica]|uniref:Uncharacterized protein n=1 Tax=Popillia japonica TaxID=7064 RepID=A0AAW1HHL2_POPJA